MTHCRLCWLKPRSLLIEGRAMLRIEASRTSMNWTMLSRSRMATPRRDESVDVATVAGAGAVMSWGSLSGDVGPPWVMGRWWARGVAAVGGGGGPAARAGGAVRAEPLFNPQRFNPETGADSSLATLHGLYWLSANLATRRPLLLTIDDLHWCDLPSLRWLAYLLPRMEGLALSVLVGLRPAEAGEDPGLLNQIVADPLATVIRPAPLSLEATMGFVREALSPSADDAFCAACWRETAGNPLLVRELVLVVAAEGLAPTEANVPRLRELGARAGSRAVSLRLSRLQPEATTLAQAVAILGDDADPRQAAALADLEEQAASEAVEALVRVDVLRSQQPLAFVHPLIRAAVYESLTALDPGRGHERGADLLARAGAEPERVAAQLLRSPPSGSSEAVTTLREAARRAGTRGASESAVAYL